MTTTLRSLAQSRGFSLTAILTLGTGLALCLIVAGLANAYLFRPMPYPAADRLYNIQFVPPNERTPRGLDQVNWASLDDIVEHPIAWDLDVFYLLGGSYPERAPGSWVTAGYVPSFGLTAALGRTLVPADFETGRPMVAMISHQLWQSRFGGDPSVIGRHLTAFVSDRPDEPESLEIVGVIRPDFWQTSPYTQVIAPLRARVYPYMLRLRSGVPVRAAEDRISALVHTVAPTAPRVALRGAQEAYVAAMRPVLLAIGAAAILVLVIACANVAVLMLIRSQRRERDVVLRVALGASRAHVVRMLAAEALWLGTAATVLGTVVAWAALGWLVPFAEGLFERRVPGGAATITFDPWLAGFAVTIGLTSTLAFSLMPAVGVWRRSLGTSIATGGRGATLHGARSGARSVLIGLEVAVSLTLLTGALLMTTSAMRMLAIDFGIAAEGVAAAGLSLRQQSYPDTGSRAAMFERLLARMTTFTQGQIVAMGDWWPLQAPPPRQFDAGQGAIVDGGTMSVSEGYFAALGISIREGRAFAPSDRAGGEPVVIVSQSLAQRLWPSGGALGQTVRISTIAPSTPAVAQSQVHRIVGVAGDVRQSHTDASLLDAYVPLLQNASRFTFLFLPTGVSTPARDREMREAVADIDPELSIGTPMPLQGELDRARLRPRVLASMLSAFAIFAALLALLGMYGVVSYAVRQREREVAVRMAVGADRRSVTALFLKQGSVVLLAGVMAGALGALGMGRVLSAQLFGVGGADPRVIASAAAALIAGGLAAIWWPARRAASTDPAIVLKTD